LGKEEAKNLGRRENESGGVWDLREPTNEKTEGLGQKPERHRPT